MKWIKAWDGRLHSILAFSFLSVYILSFLFEGQILYGLLALHGVPSSTYTTLAMAVHFLGLSTSWLYTRSAARARIVMVCGIGAALLAAMPFFFQPSSLWAIGLAVGGYSSGAALAAWGYFLKAYTPRHELLKTCAEILICSNILMVLINALAVHVSPSLGLTVVMLFLAGGLFSAGTLGRAQAQSWTQGENAKKRHLWEAFALLSVFIAVLTINSGLMYQVLNPAFQHLSGLTTWYWPLPYIAALFILRNLSGGVQQSRLLYVGMAMMIGAFLCFMLLGRSHLDYVVVNTLMMGACGVFDLFWWSILAEMMGYTENPSIVFGLGLSSNVLGVLAGGLVGAVARSTQRLTAEVTVMALTVVCFTLALLPVLNRRLTLLLKGHAYLTPDDLREGLGQAAASYQMEPLEPLTSREQEVLATILSGMSNREIADALNITESTVKTHVRNIYSKYGVHSRAELLSGLLKGEGL